VCSSDLGVSPDDAVTLVRQAQWYSREGDSFEMDAELIRLEVQRLSPQAAALPLTAITAWETLFDRLDTGKPVPGAAPAILIVGGAGLLLLIVAVCAAYLPARVASRLEPAAALRHE